MAMTTEPEHKTITVAEVAEQEEAIRPLLARANLFRVRGQWNEAIAVCTEALRKAPYSASAHSLLGDIYEAQGRIDDAVQWYSMAVDLQRAGSGVIDRTKLERAMARQKRAVTEERIAAASPTPSTPATKPAAEKTIEWFDRLFPPGRPDSIARLIITVCGGIAVVLLLSATVVHYTLRHEAVDSQATIDDSLPPALMTPVTPVVMTPKSLKPPQVAVDASPEPQIRTPAVRPSPSGATSLDTIRPRIAALLPSGVSFVGANIARRGEPLTLQVAIPAVAEPIDRTRDRIVRAAAAAERAASQTLSAAGTGAQSAFTQARRDVVQVVVHVRDPRQQTATEGVQAASSVAFVAEAAPGSMRGLDPATAAASDILSRFRSLQWSAGLMPATAAGVNQPANVPPTAQPTAIPPEPTPPPQLGNLTSPLPSPSAAPAIPPLTAN